MYLSNKFLKFHRTMIKYCHPKVYISLDSVGISKLIDALRKNESYDYFDEEENLNAHGKVNERAEKLYSNIFNYKASLRKYYIINGQAKILT